jgi:hypothetical protein
MTDWQPYSARLRNELERLARLGEELLDASTIEYRGDFNRGRDFVIVAPDWAWGKPTDELRRIQMRVVPQYEAWWERFDLLFKDAPEELKQEIEQVHAAIREWISRTDNGWTGWDVPRTIGDAKATLSERFHKLRQFLDVVAPSSGEGGVLAIPDTSALIDAPDLARYPGTLGVTKTDIYLVPGVLSELDALKDQGRNPDIREKARAAGRAIRDLRQGGSLLDGVELVPGVRVFSRPQEPEFDGLPGRLDRSVPDDRILAAAFELQREHPTAAVVLVTGDLNMQTKAELARLPFAEPPGKPKAAG